MSWKQTAPWFGALSALLLLLPTGCGDEEGTDEGKPSGGEAGTAGTAGNGGGAATGGSGDWTWVEMTMSLPDGPAMDPKLGGDPSLRIGITSTESLPTECTVSVEALEPGGRVAQVADAVPWVDGGIEVMWNGRDEADVPFDPGPVQLVADLYCTERMQGFGEIGAYILRLGVVAVDWEGDTVPLAYHKLTHEEFEYTEVGGPIFEYLSDKDWALELADLDHDDGSPRAALPPWHDPDCVPWGTGTPSTLGLGSHNVPVAYVAGGNVTLHAYFGTNAVSAALGTAIPSNGVAAWAAEVPEVRVVLDGYNPAGNPTWAPEAVITFESAAPLPDTVGKTDVELSWGFEVHVGDQWLAVPGELITTHRVYRVVAPSMVPDGRIYDASPTVAWVGVLEDTSAAVDGIAASDVHAVMTALRHYYYDDDWVIYNPSDPSYSVCCPWGIDLTGWLDRDDGVDMVCNSTAYLLAGLSTHWGIDARYVRIEGSAGWFQTRMTRAAGTTEWLSWGFGYHVVTRLFGSGLIWDCAVDFDGDANPDATPCTPWSPVAVPEDDYLDRLSAMGTYYGDTGVVYSY